MVERTGYTNGEPCWADVMTPDVETAKPFYAALFGWSYADTGPEFGNYTMCERDGRLVAGISPPPPDAPELPAAWNLYLASDDLDATARTIAEQDGKITMGPMDIPGNGRMLYAFDPTGAAFGVWEPGAHTGAQLHDESGAMCWAEVNTRDPGTADAFYRGLFGYQQQQIGDSDQFDYTAWSLGDGPPVCGRLKMTEVWEGISPHWMVYFCVEDVDTACATVRERGGEVQHGPFDSPQGRIAVVSDPAGAVFSLIAR